MAGSCTVVVSGPEVDAVVGGALVGRAASGTVETLVYDSQGLVGFFSSSVQQRLPRGYDLVLCGMEVVHRDWDGRLVRPRLMDALRAFTGPIRWFSGRLWEADDLQAVGHVLGEGNLKVPEVPGSVAAIVRDALLPRDDAYADSLVRFAGRRLSREEEDAWGSRARLVLAALKADPQELAGAVALLMENRVEQLIAKHGERAKQVDEDNRRFARESAQEPRSMAGMKLVCLGLPPSRHCFWAEISAYARQETNSELSLCHLEGRPVMLLTCSPTVRADLRVWVRYVTDLMPAATTVGAEADFVALVVQGLTQDTGLRGEVLNLLGDGAYLLRM
jgi:hypothetical protein